MKEVKSIDRCGFSVITGFGAESVNEDTFLNSDHVGLMEDGGTTSESATAEKDVVITAGVREDEGMAVVFVTVTRIVE